MVLYKIKVLPSSDKHNFPLIIWLTVSLCHTIIEVSYFLTSRDRFLTGGKKSRLIARMITTKNLIIHLSITETAISVHSIQDPLFTVTLYKCIYR